jgi:hypothetical protein
MFKTANAPCAALGAIFAFAAVAVHAQSVPRPDWKVGDTWTVAITANSGVGGTSRREEVRVVKEAGDHGYQVESSFQNQALVWKGKATGWEVVDVPAGKFKALRLEYQRSGSNRNAACESVWYAPDAKLVVKRIQSRPGAQRSRDITTTELVSYKFN